MLCPLPFADVVDEYGGGGPEYIAAGLVIAVFDTVLGLGRGCRV